MVEREKKDGYELSRVLYVIEATLEYLVSIAVGTVYLAKITNYIGISAEINAVLTAFVSLGCGFQLFSIFLGGKFPVKNYVSAGHLISQALFTALYVIPLLGIAENVKAVLLVIALLAAQITHNLVHAPKTNWFMSMVHDGDRGRFTAIKEMSSLLAGTVFSFVLSAVIDGYEAAGNMQACFLAGALILGALTVGHTLTLVFAKAPKRVIETPQKNVSVISMLKNKTLLKIMGVIVLWIVAQYATLSFSGTYMNEELGFSMTFSSFVVLLGSLFRVIFSIPFGKFADKKGYCSMLLLCCPIAAAGYLLNVFTAPANGKVLYTIYYVLYCIAVGGINGSIINLIFDYMQPEERTAALALTQTVSGFAGFFVTLILSAVMSLIQKNGNSIFGVTVYSQQVFSLVSFLVVAALIVYLFKVIRKLPRAKSDSGESVDK